MNKWKHLGRYTTEEDAARAVDDYVEHGIVPECRTVASRFKGVSWHKFNNKWQARSKEKYLGHHATEEEAARAVDDYVEHGTVPECRTETSRFKGVSWHKFNNKWQGSSKGKYLGHYATEEEAARAVDDYVEHCTVPTVHESRTGRGWSQFKGVSWNKHNYKWQAESKRKYLGCHATEEEAARAVDNYVKHGTALTPKQDNGKPSTKKLQTQQTSAVRGDQFRKKTNYKFVSKIRTTS